MDTYAIIDKNIVVNIIDYETQPIAPIPGLDTSYIAVLANGAGIGWTYENGLLTAPQPYPSWILENNVWAAPTSYPDDGKFYKWNELTKSWIDA